MLRIVSLTAGIIAASMVPTANARDQLATQSMQGDQRCIQSNSTPNHPMGQFPNRGNPNAFRAQPLKVCVDATPSLTGQTAQRSTASGVSLTGILFRPGTADYYDGSTPRGHSRNPASGWRLEGMGAAETLGMDQANAHVDHRGLYHYHAPAALLTDTLQGTLIGYAADGFPIHYVGSKAQSSWQLKPGTRPTSPNGRYDGTYEQDWRYEAGSGNLDTCNGTTIDGAYVYFATDSYPFFPRCFKGTVSRDFTGPP